MTRYERNMKRNKIRKRVLFLFLLIVPLFTVAASFFLMSMYGSKSNVDAQTESEYQSSNDVFSYTYEIESKTFYRVELKSSASLAEAEEYQKSIRNKKLNGFIMEEDRYKVIYGIFTNLEQAEKIRGNISKKTDAIVTETKLPGFRLKYNDRDNAFMQLVQATDKLIWEISEAKARLCTEIAMQSKNETLTIITDIESGEIKLKRYLGYAEEVTVSKEQENLRDHFVLMLQEVLKQKLDDGKNFNRIQSGLINQIETYRKYSEELSNM